MSTWDASSNEVYSGNTKDALIMVRELVKQIHDTDLCEIGCPGQTLTGILSMCA